MNRHAEFGLALLLDLVGAAGALLVATRTWQTVRTPGTFRGDVLEASGRTVDSSPTALALVALAGVVALLATRGTVRRAVGAILVLAGAGLIWRSSVSSGAMSTGEARDLVASKHKTVPVEGVVPHITVHGAWPLLSVVAGVLVLIAGALVVLRGHRWQAMSAKYEARPAPSDDPAKAATTMWSALDRGEDPTD